MIEFMVFNLFAFRLSPPILSKGWETLYHASKFTRAGVGVKRTAYRGVGDGILTNLGYSWRRLALSGPALGMILVVESVV